MAKALHNPALAWQDHSHTKSSLVMKNVWACCMPNNILVLLTHVQLKSFYLLSTHDVTHVRKCTRPSPVQLASNGKLGEGLGTRLCNS